MLAVADTDDPAEIEELTGQIETVLSTVYEQSTAKLLEVVTPQQLAKLRELDLQLGEQMAEMGFPVIKFDAYAALDLTPSQQEKLDKIRAESEVEQLQFMDEFTKMMPKPGQKPTPEEMKAMQEKMEKRGEESKKLIAKIKSRILVILDKKQQAKLEELLKNVPDYVKNKLKMQPPSKPVDEKKYEAWKDAWKPGDPIPEEFRAEEKSSRRAFPSAR